MGNPRFAKRMRLSSVNWFLRRRADIWDKRYGTREELAVENETLGTSTGGS